MDPKEFGMLWDVTFIAGSDYLELSVKVHGNQGVLGDVHSCDPRDHSALERPTWGFSSLLPPSASIRLGGQFLITCGTILTPPFSCLPLRGEPSASHAGKCSTPE